MNIDKNLIKYWSYICEDKNPLTHDRDDEYYGDFIPYDDEDDDLGTYASVLDWLSKEFKKNPDEGLKYLTKNKKDLGDLFKAISSEIQKNLENQEKLRKQTKTISTKYSSDNGPFSFDNCYRVVLKNGFFTDNDALCAYFKTKDEALKLFDAVKSISNGDTIRLYEVRKGKEKIIKGREKYIK